MRVYSTSILKGSRKIWSAWCYCPCGWTSPSVTSTSQRLAEVKAVEFAGGGVIPEDRDMEGKEVKEFVRKFIRQ